VCTHGVQRTDGGLVLELDAVLPACAVLDEARLIGRRTTAPRATAVVGDVLADGVGAGAVALVVPADVAVGDLVCFPCRQALTHRALTHRTLTEQPLPERALTQRVLAERASR
jgi:hypothetical protein